MYNLTPTQKALLRSLVEKVRAKQMPEEFTFIWGLEGTFLHYDGAAGFHPTPEVTKSALTYLLPTISSTFALTPEINLALPRAAHSQARLMRRLIRISRLPISLCLSPDTAGGHHCFRYWAKTSLFAYSWSGSSRPETMGFSRSDGGSHP